MKIKSPEELDDRIREDLTWRRHEIQFFDQQIKSANPIAARSLLRASVALLYAHWEGFVKTACHYYLCYVACLRLPTGRLSPELAALSLRTVLHDGIVSNSPKLHAAMVQGIRESSDSRSRIPTKRDAVKTRSNLSFQVLEHVLASVGLDANNYAKYEDLINVQLVEARNRVAHGENDYIAASEWRALEAEVFSMMESIGNRLVTKAMNKDYLAQSPPI